MKKIKYIFIYIISVILLTIPLPAEAAPVINASSAIMIEADTGNILFSKNADDIRPPASTTKIITALLAIECGNLEMPVKVSEKAALTNEASIYLTQNDLISLNSLVHGALIKSGNDACIAIAETIAPSEEEFVGLMNLKAKTLGAQNTTFFNTNGLPHQKHLTTASDLAMITRYALNNPVFREIVQKKTYELQWLNPPRHFTIKNTNKLLWAYPYATGVKTGTTVKAGKCLVASAKHDDRELIVVLLDSPDRFGDAQKLFEYGIKEKEKSENVY